MIELVSSFVFNGSTIDPIWERWLAWPSILGYRAWLPFYNFGIYILILLITGLVLNIYKKIDDSVDKIYVAIKCLTLGSVLSLPFTMVLVLLAGPNPILVFWTWFILTFEIAYIIFRRACVEGDLNIRDNK